jgi:high-affinity K+ transport system ATPase subunit B
MKMNENKKMLLMSKINLVLSVFLLAMASFWFLQNSYEGKPYYETLIFVILGLTLLITSFFNIKRFKAESEGKTIADERSLRVGEKAASFAFLLLIAVLIVSGLANSFFNLRLEYTITVYVISVASMFSLIIIGYYLDKKGEV